MTQDYFFKDYSLVFIYITLKAPRQQEAASKIK